MIKHLIITSILTVVATVAAPALEIEMQRPGSLYTKAGQTAGVTELKLSGPIDASDLFFIGGHLSALTSLDLSGATIEAYDGKAYNGTSSYPKSQIPAGSLAGLGLTDIKLPQQPGLTIGDTALSGTALTSVVLPANVGSVGMGAFAGCNALASVTVQGSVEIGEAAFADCTALQSVGGSQYVTAIGRGAFARCTALGEWSFGPSLESVGAMAFEHTALAKADFSRAAKLTEIGDWAFAGCTGITQVMMGGTLSHIGRGAFFNCRQLRTIYPGQSVEEIADYAFTNDSDIANYNMLSESTARIGAYALKGNTSITNLRLPATVEYIGDNAMEDMTSLATLNAELLTEVPRLGADVWAGVKQNEVELIALQELESAFATADQWCEFRISISGVGDETAADVHNRVSASFSGTTLVVKVTDPEARSLRLYNAGGQLLAATAADGEGTYTFDTSAKSDHVYMVNLSRTDGSCTALKIARK